MGCCSLLYLSGFDSSAEICQATSKGIGEDVLHHIAHVCDLLPCRRGRSSWQVPCSTLAVLRRTPPSGQRDAQTPYRW
jgi:hypothetical protein